MLDYYSVITTKHDRFDIKHPPLSDKVSYFFIGSFLDKELEVRSALMTGTTQKARFAGEGCDLHQADDLFETFDTIIEQKFAKGQAFEKAMLVAIPSNFRRREKDSQMAVVTRDKKNMMVAGFHTLSPWQTNIAFLSVATRQLDDETPEKVEEGLTDITLSYLPDVVRRYDLDPGLLDDIGASRDPAALCNAFYNLKYELTAPPEKDPDIRVIDSFFQPLHGSRHLLVL